MARDFYCNKCEEEVTLSNGKCPKCGTNWKKIIDDSVNDDKSSKVKDDYDLKDYDDDYDYDDEISVEEDIELTYTFYLKYAKFAKNFLFFMAVLVGLLSLILLDSTEGASLLLLFVSLTLIVYAIFIEKHIKWKAYMLLTNYETMKK